MNTVSISGETPNPPAQQFELWERRTVLRFFGGDKPINIGTLYRGIASGRYPKPVHVGGVRWLRSECEAALNRMIGERDGRKRISRRGPHRLHRITDTP